MNPEILLGLMSGIAFGFVIQRVGATDPDKMAKAHLMREPGIPMFMLTAVILSALGIAGLKSAGIDTTRVLPLSLGATTIAGLLFGIGWGLCGYCPGTTWAAAGEGRMDALFALAGGLAGTALFAQFHETLIPLLYDPFNLGRLTLTGLLGSPPAALAALCLGLGFMVLVIHRVWGKDLF